jgi:hypothetical protein
MSDSQITTASSEYRYVWSAAQVYRQLNQPRARSMLTAIRNLWCTTCAPRVRPSGCRAPGSPRQLRVALRNAVERRISDLSALAQCGRRWAYR